MKVSDLTEAVQVSTCIEIEIFVKKFLYLNWYCIFMLTNSLSWGTYKVRNEIETKRNQRKRNETKRNQRKRNETKRNQRKRNETKRNQRNGNEMKRNQRNRLI